MRNQLLVHIHYLRYTFSVSNKRPLAPSFPLCRYSFADGRRCAQPASPDSSGLCYSHAHTPPRRLRRSDLLRELAPAGGSSASPAQVQRFLAMLPRALAEGLIGIEDLRAYRYLCQVMLEAAHKIELNKRRDPAPSAASVREPNVVPIDEPRYADLSAHPPRP